MKYYVTSNTEKPHLIIKLNNEEYNNFTNIPRVEKDICMRASYICNKEKPSQYIKKHPLFKYSENIKLNYVDETSPYLDYSNEYGNYQDYDEFNRRPVFNSYNQNELQHNYEKFSLYCKVVLMRIDNILFLNNFI